jgi:hypothetical protein
MKRLLGYAFHRASVALHGVAVRLVMNDCGHEPSIWIPRRCDYCDGRGSVPTGIDADQDWCPKCGGAGNGVEDVELPDVAPRLAATIDWVLSHITRRNQ